MKLDTRRYFDKIQLIQKLVGLSTSKPSSCVFRVYSYFSVIFFLLINCILKVCNLHDLARRKLEVSLTANCCLATAKGLVVLIQNKRLIELFDKIKSFEIKSENERKYFEKRIEIISKTALFYVILIVVAINVNSLYAIYTSNDPFVTLPEIPGMHSTESLRNSIIVNTYAIIGNSVLCTMLTTIDSDLGFIVYMISSQVVIVGKRLSKIGHPEKDQPNSVQNLQFVREFIEITKYQQDVPEMKRNVLKIYSIIWALQLLVSGINMAAFITDWAFGIGDPFSYSMGPGALIIQIGLPCLLGQLFKQSHEQFSDSLYNLNWPKLIQSETYRKKYVKGLLISMECYKEKHEIIAAKLVPLNLETYQAVMNMAYRLFTVLKNSY